jgi:hypothetical protein
MKKYIYYFVLLIAVIACNKSEEGFVELTMNEDVLSTAKDAESIRMETVEIDSTFLGATSYYIYRDSVLIVVNTPSESCPLLELYNLNTQISIKKIIPYGKRKNEVTSGFVKLSGNLLLVNDWQQNKRAIIDIDSLLNTPNYRFDFLQANPFMVSDVVPFKNDLVLENPFCFTNKELGIEETGKRILYLKEADSVFDTPHKYKTANVTQGLLIVNSTRDKLIYASGVQNFYEVYNDHLQPTKRVLGPRTLPIKYQVFDGGDVMFSEGLPFFYTGYCTTDKYVYLLYLGVINNWDNEEYERTNHYLFKLNWEGDVVDCYNLGMHISTISASATSDNIIYVCTLDDDGLPVIYRLNLETQS